MDKQTRNDYPIRKKKINVKLECWRAMWGGKNTPKLNE